MSSGIKLASECVETFNNLKLGRKFKAVVYRISADKSQIEVESTLPPTASFDDFTKALPEKTPRYVVFDFEYESEGANKSKIFFVAWNPDTAKIGEKMLYTSSKDALRKALVGVHQELQGTDLSEVSRESFMEKANKI